MAIQLSGSLAITGSITINGEPVPSGSIASGVMVAGTGTCSIVGTGCGNSALGDYSFAGGGCRNDSSGLYSFVGGGTCNVASGCNSFTGGGNCSTASGIYSFIGAGYANRACGVASAVVAGNNNYATGANSTILGGNLNCTYCTSAVIISGYLNRACNCYASVVNGYSNTASGKYSFIGGGNNNCAIGCRSAVVGGNYNCACAYVSFVGGGQINLASGNNSFVGGGQCNTTSGNWSSIGGGFNNTASGVYSTVGGGSTNTASCYGVVISGGVCNTASGNYSTISGGYTNIARNGGFIGAGSYNETCTQNDVVVGGSNNTASAGYSFVGSGRYNTASGYASVVVGGGGFGIGSCATGCRSAVVGGRNNTASGAYSSILGGQCNTISGFNSGILGGCNNTLGNCNSFIIGSGLTSAANDTTYVSNLNTAGNLIVTGSITGSNATIAGNVGIGTSSPSQKLEVVGGEIKAGRVDSSQEGGQVSFGRASDNNTTWYIDAYGSSTSPQLRFVNVDNAVVAMALTGSNVGIGTTSPAYPLDVQFGGNISQRLRNNAAGGTATLILETANTFSGTSQAYIQNIGSAGGGQSQLVFATAGASGDTTATERMRITSDGNVGIGNTDAVTVRLRVRGSNATSANYGLYIENSTPSLTFAVRNDGAIYAPGVYNFSTGTGANVVVFSDGSMQRSTSSLRYKKNVLNYTKGLAEVMQLRPVTYESKNSREEGVTFAGLIAEEVHELGLTEFVQYADDGSPDALSYQNMIALAFKAIQEQQAIIEELTTRLTALENK